MSFATSVPTRPSSFHISGLALAVLLALPGFLGSAAHAAPVTYQYTAECFDREFPPTNVYLCSDLNLTNGEVLMGTIVFDDGNFAPGATIEKADVLSFEFNFGLFSINHLDVLAFNPYFRGDLAADGMTFVDFHLSAVEAALPARGRIASLRSGNFSSFGFDGACFLPGIGGVCQGTTGPSAGNGSYAVNGMLTKVNDEVPEPTTVTLFGLGLAAAGLTQRWRRRRR